MAVFLTLGFFLIPWAVAQPALASDTMQRYYRYDHADQRMCPSPLCGGSFVRTLNAKRSLCGDGTWLSSCYAGDMDLDGLGLDPPANDDFMRRFNDQEAVVRGFLEPRSIAGVDVPVLRVTEAWVIASGKNPKQFVYFRVSSSGIVCITAPCNSLTEEKLNTALKMPLADIDFAGAKASDGDVDTAMNLLGGPGVVVAGNHNFFFGPGGLGRELLVTRLYLPYVADSLEGAVCGGIAGAACSTGQYCDIEIPGACNGADLTGICVTPPLVCTQEYAPVCGCDGNTYNNNCMRRAAGVQQDHTGACAP